MLQGYAIQEFHGDKGLAILIADVVNGANVGMIQRRRSLCLALKAGQCLRIAGNFFGKELEGNETPQPCVLGFVHYSHPAATKFLHNAVMRNGLADHSGVRVALGSLHLTDPASASQRMTALAQRFRKVPSSYRVRR